MCDEGNHTSHRHHNKKIKDRIISVLSFSFVDMPKEIGLELIIGLILAALVASVTPLGILIKNYLAGSIGYIFALIFGLIRMKKRVLDIHPALHPAFACKGGTHMDASPFTLAH